jgi:tetratricopeptide (TPR) repeat protein
VTPEAFVGELRATMALLNAGKAGEAKPRIERLISVRPEQSDPYVLLGLALDQLGDPAAGEAQIRRAMALAPAKAQYPFELARLLSRASRPDAAAQAYRAHLRLAPGHAAARHNLGVALLDAGEADAAEAELRSALAAGHDQPETWLVLGRALEAQGRHDEAEAAYRAALQRRPTDLAAHQDLAQLVWRRTQDLAAADAALAEACSLAGAAPELHMQRAKLREYAGEVAGALALLERALETRREDTVLLAAAAQMGLALAPDAALARAEAAVRQAPADPRILMTLAQAQLAVGDGEGARASAQAALTVAPLDQQAIALEATARRLLRDSSYREVFDDGLVRTYRLGPPPGWPDLPGFLSDLEAALLIRHRLAGHPIGQSTRGGGEAALDPRFERDPVIRAFFEAVRAPIARHIAEIGCGEGPFRSRVADSFRIAGAWSVRLRPGGFHASHVHPRGWISSAFYVGLPPAVADAEARAGWLKFGEPGPPTKPALAAEHYIRPEPGLLALFPSYVWHGTVPFGGDAPRLTIAFDVVPA